MRIAVSTFQNIVSAIFDFAQEITVYDISGNRITRISIHSIHEPIIPLCVSKLKELKVKRILCGDISNHAAIMLAYEGIEIMPGITGPTDEVINSFIRGTLDSPKNRIPGFFHLQQRINRGGRHIRRRLRRLK